MASVAARAGLLRACCRRAGSLYPRTTLVRHAPAAARDFARAVSTLGVTSVRGGAHPWQRVGALQCGAARGLASSALPEHVVVCMPALSPTMTQGTIVSWSVDIG